MSHGRWWGSLLPLNHLRTAASPCPRWFPLKFGNFCQDMEWQRMVVWASILQSTADIRHLYRFAKEIHQQKAKSMVFQYSKYLVDFNKISPIPSWKKPWDTNLMTRTSTLYHTVHHCTVSTSSSSQSVPTAEERWCGGCAQLAVHSPATPAAAAFWPWITPSRERLMSKCP